MSEYTNGVHVASDRPKGRAVPEYPAITLSSGYTLHYRRMATGTMATLRQQAYKELLPEQPKPPVQSVEYEPGKFRDVERTSDPDYQAALEAWNDRVTQATAIKWLKLVQGYAVVSPTDEAAVAAYREAMAGLGVELPTDDRELFLWSIAAPAASDQRALTAAILQISEPSPEAVQAHQATFRGDVSGEATGATPEPTGPSEL